MKDPKIEELLNKLREGGLNRREFIRIAGLLGISAGAAEILSACGSGINPKATSDVQIQYEGFE